MHRHLSDVFALMDQSRDAVRAAVEAVPPQARGRRPAPDRWSVTEILEHLGLVDARFEGVVSEALAKARTAGLATEGHARVPLTEALRARLGDRSERRDAPEGMVPTGTLDEGAAWAALEAAREKFRATVASGDGLALGSVTAEHRRWGPLTIYQWVEVLAAHEQRHAAQIAEVAAQLQP